MESVNILLLLVLTGITVGDQSTEAPVPTSAIKRTLYDVIANESSLKDKERDTKIEEFVTAYPKSLREASTGHQMREKRFSFWHPFGKPRLEIEVFQQTDGKQKNGKQRKHHKHGNRNRYLRKPMNKGTNRRRMQDHNHVADNQNRHKQAFRYGK